VGLAAVQLARLRHAEIYGTTAGEHAFLQAQGVHHTIDYYTMICRQHPRITGGRGLDVSSILGGLLAQSYECWLHGRLLLFAPPYESWRRNLRGSLAPPHALVSLALDQ
jgi:hypothetical protein